MNTVTSI